MKITVLLGAGASKGAGVPISAEMTAALLDKIDPRSKALLHYVYGGVLMQEAAKARGSYLRQPIVVDAENLFNAVEALANRTTLDVAPFVSSWHPLIDQFDKHPHDIEREIKNALDLQSTSLGANNLNLARTLARIISRGTTSNHLQQVAIDMVSALKELLAISEPGRLEYLVPLLDLYKTQGGGLVIASLDYDTLIEQVGTAHSVPVDDCLDQWLASGSIKRSGALTLLKLHGSINWVQDPGGSIRRATAKDYTQPALIFGGINKLRADGPYLEILWEWRSHLDQCDHLVIIGYSLRDTHVNAMIERWHRDDEMKRVTIVDPGYDRNANSLARYLYQLSNENLAPFEITGNVRRQGITRLEAPVQLIRARAEDALPDLFTRISHWPPTSTDRPTLGVASLS